jgi:hypothetical protein
MAQQLRLLLHRGRAIEKNATPFEQLLAFSSQQKSPPDPVEEPQTEFPLEIDDLPRQGGLSGPQAQCRF